MRWGALRDQASPGHGLHLSLHRLSAHDQQRVLAMWPSAGMHRSAWRRTISIRGCFERVLLTPVKPDVREGADILWRERDGIRIVVLENPTPPTGAKLVKTVYRIEAQAKAR